MTRHRWLKLRIHCYICRKCGTGKVNARGEDGWFATFYCGNGTTVLGPHVPPCEVGPKTEAYLGKYAKELSA
jgi:hypothetical protein